MREIFDLAKTYLFTVTAVFFTVALFAFAGYAFAQDPASLPADLTTSESLDLMLKSLGGLKGASALGIVVVVVQVLMRFFQSPLAAFAGKWRLLVVSVLSLVGGVLAMKLAGVDWVGALTHSATLTSVTVFGHQLLVQFKKSS